MARTHRRVRPNRRTLAPGHRELVPHFRRERTGHALEVVDGPARGPTVVAITVRGSGEDEGEGRCWSASKDQEKEGSNPWPGALER